MQFLFDNVTASVVGSLVLLLFAAVQQRGGQAAADASMRHMTMTRAQSLVEMIEQDVENMGSASTSPIHFDCALEQQTDTAGTSHTRRFVFTTLGDPRSQTPDTSSASGLTAQKVKIRYELAATGATAFTIDAATGAAVNRPLYRIERSVDDLTGGGYGPALRTDGFLAQFNIVLQKGGDAFEEGDCRAEGLEQVNVSFQAVAALPAAPRSTAHVNTVRFGTTLRPFNLPYLK